MSEGNRIEPGRYMARAAEWKLGKASTGTECIAVLFTLQDGRTINWWGYFSEKTAERTLDSLEFMGWDGRDIANPRGLDRNEVELVVGEETNDKGESFSKVLWVNRPRGAAVKEELKGAELSAFQQRMQAAMLARKQNKASQAPTNEPDEDDYYDRPF